MGLEWARLRAGMSIWGCSTVVVVSGITLAFSVFAKALKDSFQLSQVEVSLLASATNFGHNIVLPAGFVNDRMGTRWSMIPGCIFTCLGWGTVLVTLLERDTLGHDFTVTVLSIALFAAGHGRTYFFLTGVATVIHNVPENLRPAALSFMELLCGLIPLVYPVLFGESLQDGSHNVFVIFISCSLGLSLTGGILGSLLMTRNAILMDENCNVTSLSSKHDEINEDTKLINGNEEGSMEGRTTHEHRQSSTSMLVDSKKSKSVLLSVDYQLIFWISTVLTAITMFYDYNTVFLLISESYKLESVDIIILYRGTNTGTRFLVCLCLYLFKNKRGIPFLLPALCGVFTVASIMLVLFFAQYLWCLQLAYALIGAVCGMVFVFPVVLICDIYGPHNFGRNIGLLNSAIPIFMLTLNLMFSYIYDDQIQDKASRYCHGKRCFYSTLIITLVLSIICACLSPVIYFRHRKSFKSTQVE